MALVDKDGTFDKIWEVLVGSSVLTDKELQYLDKIHQKALSADEEKCTCCCHRDPYCPLCRKGTRK
jgi:hypothetical protein